MVSISLFEKVFGPYGITNQDRSLVTVAPENTRLLQVGVYLHGRFLIVGRLGTSKLDVL